MKGDQFEVRKLRELISSVKQIRILPFGQSRVVLWVKIWRELAGEHCPVLIRIKPAHKPIAIYQEPKPVNQLKSAGYGTIILPPGLLG